MYHGAHQDHFWWVQNIRAASAGTIWFVLVLFCPAKMTLHASAMLHLGVPATYKGLLPIILPCKRP